MEAKSATHSLWLESKNKTVRLGLWHVYFERKKYKRERHSKKGSVRFENRLGGKMGQKNVSGWALF